MILNDYKNKSALKHTKVTSISSASGIFPRWLHRTTPDRELERPPYLDISPLVKTTSSGFITSVPSNTIPSLTNVVNSKLFPTHSSTPITVPSTEDEIFLSKFKTSYSNGDKSLNENSHERSSSIEEIHEIPKEEEDNLHEKINLDKEQVNPESRKSIYTISDEQIPNSEQEDIWKSESYFSDNQHLKEDNNSFNDSDVSSTFIKVDDDSDISPSCSPRSHGDLSPHHRAFPFNEEQQSNNNLAQLSNIDYNTSVGSLNLHSEGAAVSQPLRSSLNLTTDTSSWQVRSLPLNNPRLCNLVSSLGGSSRNLPTVVSSAPSAGISTQLSPIATGASVTGTSHRAHTPRMGTGRSGC